MKNYLLTIHCRTHKTVKYSPVCMQKKKAAFYEFFNSEELKCICEWHTLKLNSNKIGFCPPLNGHICIWYNHTTFPDSGSHYKGEEMYYDWEAKQQTEI